jgi:cbb3-type cytochrome oxidase subunit 3
MKYLVRILFLIVLGLIAFGYYHKNNGSTEGDKWVGIGVLVLAFILMPVFIYHRYRNKKLKDYELNFNFKEDNNTENQ